jgi:hypothetical protein
MFLRHCLNPISVATGVTWMVMHHTPKPPKEGNGGQTLYDLAYAGLGSSELTNWARAVVYLQAVKEGHFKLSFPKARNKGGYPVAAGRLGCPLPASTPTTCLATPCRGMDGLGGVQWTGEYRQGKAGADHRKSHSRLAKGRWILDLH